jgi:hypothetical protein
MEAFNAITPVIGSFLETSFAETASFVSFQILWYLETRVYEWLFPQVGQGNHVHFVGHACV